MSRPPVQTLDNAAASPTPSPASWSSKGPAGASRFLRRWLDSSNLQLLATVALLALPGWLFLRSYYLVDPDIWWHLSTAKWIWAHHGVPATDPFSLFGAGKPWVAYTWLWDLFADLLYRWFGLSGMILYEVGVRTALAAALFHLARGRSGNFWRALFFTAVALFATLDVAGPRPGMVTILFAIIEMDLLLRARNGRFERLWVLPPFFALWANCHIQFGYGLFLLGVFAIEPAANALLRYRAEPLLAGSFRQRWVLFAASALATLVNPYGWRVYETVLQYIGQNKAFHYITELQAMTFRQPQHFAALLLALAAAFALGRRREARPLWLLLLAVSAALSFRAVKDIWFVALIALCILADTGADRLASHLPLRARRMQALAAAVLTLAILAVGYRRFNVTNDFVEMSVAGSFPAGAARYIRQHHLPQPLYNDFNDGGYLIWALPGYKVAIDGRTNVHGDDRVEQFSHVWRGWPEWSADPELSAARTVVALRQAALASLLQTDPRFQKVYEDSQYLLFERR